MNTSPNLQTTNVPRLDSAAALGAAREFAARFAETAARRDQLREQPLPELAELRASGLLAISVPVEFGGPDLPRATIVEVFRTLAAGDPAIAQLVLPHFVGLEELRVFPDAGRTREIIFAEVLAGAQLGNAVSERSSDRSIKRRTIARQEENGDWTVSGRKYYATGSLGATWIVVIARTPDGDPVTLYVAGDAPGVELHLEEWSAFGQRATFSGGVGLDEVGVPGDLVLDYRTVPKDAGPSVTGSYSQALHAALEVGIARAAFDDGGEFIRTRTRPFIESGLDSATEDPHLLRRFGELSTHLNALELMLARGAAKIDAALAAPELTDDLAAAASIAVAEAKTLAQEVALEITAAIFELTGTGATDSEFDLDRHWRNVSTHATHDPARWKLQHVGNYALNGTKPPRSNLI